MKPLSFTTNRRRFIQTAVAASLGPFILPSGLRAATNSPNDRLNVAFIGVGKQGGHLLSAFLKRPDVQVSAVCDVDTNRRDAAKKRVEDFYAKDKPGSWKGCTSHNDFREIVDMDDIDAVVIATPDHWHAIIVVAAAKAGKDILCEKPMTQTIHESVSLVKCVRDQKRVFQTGSMQRSFREFRVASEIVRNGGIGKVSRIETYFGVPGVPCDLPEEAAEPGLDWDLWLGPAAMRPYNSVLAPRGVHTHYPMWRLYREFGGGFVTDWGAHHVDIAHWAMGEDENGPVEIVPPANYESAKEGAILKYAAGYELLHKAPADGRGASFYGSDGELHVARGKIEVIRGGKPVAKFWDKEKDTLGLLPTLDLLETELLKDAKVRLEVSADHYTNFVECIKSRAQPITHEGIGASSINACHLMNFAYYHGQKFGWDPKAHAFLNGTGDAKWLKTDYRGDWKV